MAVAGAGFAVAGPRAGSGSAPPVPELSWSPCPEDEGGKEGFTCAKAEVPLDYREPDGRKISLAVTRHKVADPAQRQGTLFLQPGGPGSSGVDFARGNYTDLPAGLRDRFDVLGYDVRGVGRSSPLECWDDKQYLQAVTEAKGNPGPGAFAPALRTAAGFNQACLQKSADLLPFVGTDYVARDIDLLRQALGEEQLTFYGRSFGSYIGTVYADLFPDRVRAMVLDGAYDPVKYADRPHAYDRGQYLALDGAVDRFLDWCADEPSACGFGGGSPKESFGKLVRDVDADPVPTSGGGKANGYTLVYRLLFNINEGKVLWPAIGEALHRAELRNAESFLLKPPSAASFDFLTANVVVECADRAYPHDTGLLERRLAANTEDAPLLGPALGYGPPTYDHQHGTACDQWPGEQVSRHEGSYRAEGSAPILVLGTTGDPDTPYRDAVALSRRLDNASLLTFKAEGHTAFGRSECATAAVTSYLTDLILPPERTVCADEKPPAPGPSSPSKAGSRHSEHLEGVSDLLDLIGVAR
ncbi:alpha/beta hydrolase [Streptomyces sp. 7N604]|uniref:alpha/beta hydrolase n=1 Tax=Streptomyces sp. 7N604 TaxID=3457415 RepID=UPI003FD2B9D3